jgi:hypothetical protein
MERLIFVCPATDQEIDVGITSDLTSLLRMRREHVRAQCPACGQWHEWLVGDAYLGEAVEGAAPRGADLTFTPHKPPDRNENPNPKLH